MNCKEGLPTKKPPLFNGTNYATWSIRMRIYLQALGFGILESFIISYTENLGRSEVKKMKKQ